MQRNYRGSKQSVSATYDETSDSLSNTVLTRHQNAAAREKPRRSSEIAPVNDGDATVASWQSGSTARAPTRGEKKRVAASTASQERKSVEKWLHRFISDELTGRAEVPCKLQ
jgi:hypothetical protein